MLLQLLDDGRLTDGKGHTVDFRNCVVIMTSNLGSPVIAALPDHPSPEAQEAARHAVLAELRSQFRPEFLNRVDDIIIFQRLDLAQIERIVALQLEEMRARLADRHLELRPLPPAVRWLAEKGYDPVYGARPLRRLIQRQLADRVAVGVLDGTFAEGDIITVDADASGLVVRREGRAGSEAEPEVVDAEVEVLG